MLTLSQSDLEALLERAAERGALRALGAVETPKRYLSGAAAARELGISYYDFKRLHVRTNNIWPVRGNRFERKDVERLARDVNGGVR